MTALALGEQVDRLLSVFDRLDPVSFDLGTPDVSESGAVDELVNMGAKIVTLLLERIQTNVSKRRIAYIVLALNRLGDGRALPILLELRGNFQGIETKDEWDYAVIGQCNLAIKQLRKGAL